MWLSLYTRCIRTPYFSSQLGATNITIYRGRSKSVALVYTKMYQNPTFLNIPFSRFCCSLRTMDHQLIVHIRFVGPFPDVALSIIFNMCLYYNKSYQSWVKKHISQY
jgi:hypothetical protein